MVFTKALVDTGADGILINMQFSKQLNIIAKSGVRGETIGIENRPIPIYYHNIEIELPNFPDSRIPTQIGFIDSSSVGVLLGRIDFLDKFKVTFEMYNHTFDIELKS